MIFPYGYIDQFAGVSFNTANIAPTRCRLRSPNAARLITLASGQVFNGGGGAIWPVEQVLEVLIRGNAAGGGVTVDTLLQTIAAKVGLESTLRVRVPSGGRTYSAPAVFDFIEFVAEGEMADDDVINWSILALHFSQTNNWTVG